MTPTLKANAVKSGSFATSDASVRSFLAMRARRFRACFQGSFSADQSRGIPAMRGNGSTCAAGNGSPVPTQPFDDVCLSNEKLSGVLIATRQWRNASTTGKIGFLKRLGCGCEISASRLIVYPER